MGPYPCWQSPVYARTRGRNRPRCGLQHAVHLGLLGLPAAAGGGGGGMQGRTAVTGGGVGGGSSVSAGSVVVPGSTPGSVAAPLAMTGAPLAMAPGGGGPTAGPDAAVLVAEAPATAPVASPAAAPATVAMVPPMATPMVVLRPMVSMALCCQLRTCSVNL